VEREGKEGRIPQYRVGRTLLSAAFEFELLISKVAIPVESENCERLRQKTKSKATRKKGTTEAAPFIRLDFHRASVSPW
jgi:hypothetical protein